MIKIALFFGLLIAQILIYWMVKHRWVLLISPILFFMLLYIPELFHTYEDVPAAENLKMNVARILVDSVYVLILLAPFAFAYIKKAGWRVLIVVLLALTVPLMRAVVTNKSYYLGSILYSVYFQYDDATEPYVRFEFNWPHDRYGETYHPSKPPETTRSQPSTTTQPSRI